MKERETGKEAKSRIINMQFQTHNERNNQEKIVYIQDSHKSSTNVHSNRNTKSLSIRKTKTDCAEGKKSREKNEKCITGLESWVFGDADTLCPI